MGDTRIYLRLFQTAARIPNLSRHPTGTERSKHSVGSILLRKKPHSDWEEEETDTTVKMNKILERYRRGYTLKKKKYKKGRKAYGPYNVGNYILKISYNTSCDPCISEKDRVNTPPTSQHDVYVGFFKTFDCTKINLGLFKIYMRIT